MFIEIIIISSSSNSSSTCVIFASLLLFASDCCMDINVHCNQFSHEYLSLYFSDSILRWSGKFVDMLSAAAVSGGRAGPFIPLPVKVCCAMIVMIVRS
jgi:hypothetical protein